MFECEDAEEFESDDEETSSTADEDDFDTAATANGDDCLDSHLAFLG